MLSRSHTISVRLFSITFISFFAFYQCKGQNKLNGVRDSVSFNGKLREYKIDNCLQNVLWAIVNADSAFLKYPPATFFYDLECQTNKAGQQELTIAPSRWLRSSVLSYKGIIRIGNMSFLCRGDLIKAPRFSEVNKYVDVKLMSPKPYYYDSVDVKISMFVRKPSLIGKYTLCKGGPINLIILVGKKLEGFATKE